MCIRDSFSPGSLGRLFRQNGFDVLNLEVAYAGQYLTIEAKPTRNVSTAPLAQENDLAILTRLVAEFPAKCQVNLDDWRRLVREAYGRGKKIVLWGSGSKAVSFLTTLGVGDAIEYVVDINPHRHGYYLPTTGQQIVAPESVSYTHLQGAWHRPRRPPGQCGDSDRRRHHQRFLYRRTCT